MGTYDRVRKYMKNKYNKDLADLEISDVPGYWRDKFACNNCRHPIHLTLGNSEPTYHTYYFTEPGRDENGRFLRPFRAWEELKNGGE